MSRSKYTFSSMSSRVTSHKHKYGEIIVRAYRENNNKNHQQNTVTPPSVCTSAHTLAANFSKSKRGSRRRSQSATKQDFQTNRQIRQWFVQLRAKHTAATKPLSILKSQHQATEQNAPCSLHGCVGLMKAMEYRMPENPRHLTPVPLCVVCCCCILCCSHMHSMPPHMNQTFGRRLWHGLWNRNYDVTKNKKKKTSRPTKFCT